MGHVVPPASRCRCTSFPNGRRWASWRALIKGPTDPSPSGDRRIPPSIRVGRRASVLFIRGPCEEKRHARLELDFARHREEVWCCCPSCLPRRVIRSNRTSTNPNPRRSVCAALNNTRQGFDEWASRGEVKRQRQRQSRAPCAMLPPRCCKDRAPRSEGGAGMQHHHFTSLTSLD